jgi:lysozyme family protein
MADFDEALKIVLLAEGPGGTLDPNDPGGLTVWGITRTYEKKWPGWARFDSLAHGTVHPTRNGGPVGWFDDEELTGLVREYYNGKWNFLGLQSINSQQVANAIFGAFINEGPKIVGWIQDMVGIAPDGCCGPDTICAVNEAEFFWERFSIQRLKYYNSTAKPEYLHGLINRVLQEGA